MTTTAAALLLEDIGDVGGSGFVHRLLAILSPREQSRVEAELVGRIRVLIEQLKVLNQAQDQDEFETVFDLTATFRLLMDVAQIVRHPEFAAFGRAVRIEQLTGRAPPPRDAVAQGHADDLLEKAKRLREISPVRPAARKDVARLAIAHLALTVAACDETTWADWKVGMLWNFGHRAFMSATLKSGTSEEYANELATTSRDRRLLAQPFDREQSDRALRLLGLN